MVRVPGVVVEDPPPVVTGVYVVPVATRGETCAEDRGHPVEVVAACGGNAGNQRIGDGMHLQRPGADAMLTGTGDRHRHIPVVCGPLRRHTVVGEGERPPLLELDVDRAIAGHGLLEPVELAILDVVHDAFDPGARTGADVELGRTVDGGFVTHHLPVVEVSGPDHLGGGTTAAHFGQPEIRAVGEIGEAHTRSIPRSRARRSSWVSRRTT